MAIDNAWTHLIALLTTMWPLLQVAFPYLYNNRPRKVRLSIYHHPMVMYIKTEDPELPAFYFDPLIHPISSDKTEVRGTRDDITPEDEEEFELPERVEPLLNDYPVSTEGVAAGIALLWAPEPFNKRSGRTRRAVDVPLVGSWFQVGSLGAVAACPVLCQAQAYMSGCMTFWYMLRLILKALALSLKMSIHT